MKNKDIIYDQHILDYITFNEEQIEWYDNLQKARKINYDEYIENYINSFPIRINIHD
jgi:hypothetical protein